MATNFPAGPTPGAPGPTDLGAFAPSQTKPSGKGPLIALILGAIALVAALVVSFIPFSRSADGGATVAFRAQQELDKVVFKFGETGGAKYSGKITYSYLDTPSSGERTINFKNFVVAGSNSAEGSITQDGQEAQYRQIGNNVYANGSKDFWTKLLGKVPEGLDLDSVATKWADTDGSGLLWLGSFLSPRKLAGRLAIGDTSTSTSLGQELDQPNKGLPDARFWPTSDPKVTLTGNSITVGQMTTTFDPKSKAITHIKGDSKSDDIKYHIDADVTPMSDNDRDKLFANERSFAPELVAVPAPGVPISSPRIRGVAGGSCTTMVCEFLLDLQGKPASDRFRTGYVNYGLNVTFTANGAPDGGTCNKVVRVDYGAMGRAQCDATDLPPNANVRAITGASKYLPFNTRTANEFTEIINNSEAAAKKKVTLARTGTKRPGSPMAYNLQITDMPSVYVVKQGDYQFDGFGPSGAFLVTFSTGYDQHVANGAFDPAWSGTETLKSQAAKQVAAAGGTEIVWFFAEQNSADAARRLLDSAGITNKQILTLFSKPTD